MPLVDMNQAALWDGGPNSLYVSHIDGVARGFERATKDHHYGGQTLPEIMLALESRGLIKGNRIAIIGAAFGWTAEALIDIGYGPIANGTASGKIVNVDTSTWIHANKAANATLPIINADVSTVVGRRSIKQQFGSNNAVIDWAISEDILPIYSDGEVAMFCNNLRSLATKVAHWVSVKEVSQDPRLNWKTLEEWKALVTPDYVIQRGTATVL